MFSLSGCRVSLRRQWVLAVSECCVSASRRAGRAGEQRRGREGVDDDAQQDSKERKEKKSIASPFQTRLRHTVASRHSVKEKRLCVRTSDEGCVLCTFGPNTVQYSAYRLQYYITILSKHYFSNQAVFHHNEHFLPLSWSTKHGIYHALYIFSSHQILVWL